jgi:hypothetical protein
MCNDHTYAHTYAHTQAAHSLGIQRTLHDPPPTTARMHSNQLYAPNKAASAEAGILNLEGSSKSVSAVTSRRASWNLGADAKVRVVGVGGNRGDASSIQMCTHSSHTHTQTHNALRKHLHITHTYTYIAHKLSPHTHTPTTHIYTHPHTGRQTRGSARAQRWYISCKCSDKRRVGLTCRGRK